MRPQNFSFSQTNGTTWHNTSPQTNKSALRPHRSTPLAQLEADLAHTWHRFATKLGLAMQLPPSRKQKISFSDHDRQPVCIQTRPRFQHLGMILAYVIVLNCLWLKSSALRRQICLKGGCGTILGRHHHLESRRFLANGSTKEKQFCMDSVFLRCIAESYLYGFGMEHQPGLLRLYFTGISRMDADGACDDRFVQCIRQCDV